MESPYPSKKFEQRHNVENVIVGLDSCAVIVEDSGKVKKKKKKKSKRILKKEDLVTSEDELRMKTEALIIKETDEDKDGRGRKSVIDKVRSRFLNSIYGKQANDPAAEAGKSQGSAPKKRELDRLIEEEKKQKTAEKKE